MKMMTCSTSPQTLLVLLDPSHPLNHEIATVNRRTNQSQHDTQQANEFALLHSRRLTGAFPYQPATRPIGATLTQAKQYESCAPPVKEMLCTSCASCTAAGGTPVPTR